MQLRKSFAAAVLIATTATTATVALAQTPAKKPAAPAAATATTAAAPAKAGDIAVSQAQLELIVKERVAQGQPDTPELRAFLRDELVNRELFIRAAKAKGMDRDATMKTQMQVAADSILIRQYINDYMGVNGVSDDTRFHVRDPSR